MLGQRKVPQQWCTQRFNTAHIADSNLALEYPSSASSIYTALEQAISSFSLCLALVTYGWQRPPPTCHRHLLSSKLWCLSWTVTKTSQSSLIALTLVYSKVATKPTKIFNFHSDCHILQQIFCLSRPSVPEPDIYKNCRLSFFLSFQQGQFRTALTFQSSLNINHLHFITRSAVLYRFYHSFSYRSETFSAHFIARFNTERPFVAMYACSEPCVLHTFIAMTLCAPQPQPGPPIYNATIEIHWCFWRDCDICMVTWPWLCKNVTTKLQLLLSILSCPTSFRPHPGPQAQHPLC